MAATENKAIRYGVLAVALAGFWFVLSGFLKTFILAVGALSLVLTMVLMHRMRTVDKEGVPIQVLPGLVTYLPWLLVEIVKSSWNVSMIILDPRLPISPTMVETRPEPTENVPLAIYANSITLTPGTITAFAAPDQFTVHALTGDGADDVLTGDMGRRVAAIEGA